MRYAALAMVVLLAACTSPEATRTRGGGPGADVGNRGGVVQMHEGSHPYWRTPQRLAERLRGPSGPADQPAAASPR